MRLILAICPEEARNEHRHVYPLNYLEVARDNRTTFEKIRDIVAEVAKQADETVKEENITPDYQFDANGLDSLDLVEITMSIEETFDIEIPDEDAEKMKTVQQLVDYVESKTIGEKL
ncbi:acyl carrier protein [Heliobacterium chlorum]|uniref:Acyl carrier protein n=2 Tax=Heliobacterium chlorum TaxID=2698 RepID=A0ABR7T0Y4_HELCL|nr:acyl carrier protein [Heliobacterium chlorum]